jgi:hypothetical protein
MRKLYWGCAAAGLAALGLLHAANYVWQHPETVVGRCLVWTYRAGLNFGPICRAGLYLVDRVNARPEDPEEELAEIPEEPEPIAIEEPSSVEPAEDRAVSLLCDEERGRLPGKIVIEDPLEPPLADLPSVARYDVDGIGRRLDGEGADPCQKLDADQVQGLTGRAIKAIGKLFDRAKLGRDATEIILAAGADDTRQMPFCSDDDENELLPMPYADDVNQPRSKTSAPRIWNPLPPKGTEVGDAELSPNGNDCREDPTAALQLPGCPSPACREKSSGKAEAGSEEASEPPPVEKKKSKRADPPTSKRTFDPSKLLPFAAPVKLDTMEFRPSDWGKDDVPLPPF